MRSTQKIHYALVTGVIGLLTAIGLASCWQQPAVAPGSPSPSPSISPTVAALDTTAPAGSSAATAPVVTSGSTKQTAPAASAPGTAPAGPARAASAPQEAPRPQAPPPPPPPPRTFTLEAGRSLAVYTSNSLSTKTSRVGDVFVASLASPIVDGDWVIARKGAQVEGVISNSDPGGRVKGVASLSVKLRSLQLADGRTVPISTSSYVKEAKASVKKDAVKIGIGAGIGAAIGAIAGGGKGAAIGAGIGGGGGTAAVMATRGDPAVIPSESQVTFRLTAPVKVTKGR